MWGDGMGMQEGGGEEGGDTREGGKVGKGEEGIMAERVERVKG